MPQTEVRKYLNRQWAIKEDIEICNAVAKGFYAETAEADDYERGTGDAPVLSQLRPLWEFPKHVWNEELGKRFEESWVARNPTPPTNPGYIQELFIKRITTLKKILNARVPRDGETLEACHARVELETARVHRQGRHQQRLVAVSLLQSIGRSVSHYSCIAPCQANQHLPRNESKPDH